MAGGLVGAGEVALAEEALRAAAHGAAGRGERAEARMGRGPGVRLPHGASAPPCCPQNASGALSSLVAAKAALGEAGS